MFYVLQDIDTSANDLNRNLEKISEWGFQWKMTFNQDSTKQTQEIIFSKKKTVSIHLALYFKNTPINSARIIHLGMIPDFKLKYKNLFQSVFSRVSKTIGL